MINLTTTHSVNMLGETSKIVKNVRYLKYIFYTTLTMYLKTFPMFFHKNWTKVSNTPSKFDLA